MPAAEVFDSQFRDQDQTSKTKALGGVPWQIWVVVILLGVEGIANLLSIPDHPIALWWFSAKVLFITGLLKGWTWMFGVFIVVAAIHVVGFLSTMPVASVMNFIMIALVYSARQYFFRAKK